MTRIKLCGMTRRCDIEAANELMPDYIGFVFAPKRRRYISPSEAAELKKILSPDILAVGVFLNENVETVVRLLSEDIIDIAQLHGDEDEKYIMRLKKLSAKPVIKAFRIDAKTDMSSLQNSAADFILLDSGAGTGSAFDWTLIRNIERPYFLAGGLSPDNISKAAHMLHPFAVDVSSGIETDGVKDKEKAAAFIAAVRKEDES